MKKNEFINFIEIEPDQLALIDANGDIVNAINTMVGWICGMMWLGSGAGEAPMIHYHY